MRVRVDARWRRVFAAGLFAIPDTCYLYGDPISGMPQPSERGTANLLKGCIESVIPESVAGPNRPGRDGSSRPQRFPALPIRNTAERVLRAPAGPVLAISRTDSCHPRGVIRRSSRRLITLRQPPAGWGGSPAFRAMNASISDARARASASPSAITFAM